MNRRIQSSVVGFRQLKQTAMKFGFPSLPFASANGQICALFLAAMLCAVACN